MQRLLDDIKVQRQRMAALLPKAPASLLPAYQPISEHLATITCAVDEFIELPEEKQRMVKNMATMREIKDNLGKLTGVIDEFEVAVSSVNEQV
ncbi:hypothetical protein [Aliagarivorans taiwanensis]|uniref:hypothetical protein n=1 Tax=Aliagarivorans taiwanensis TaxID=561966 RepID=UPI000415A363|nr:hypothetical protein [Aliagarivorans taiwanensis]